MQGTPAGCAYLGAAEPHPVHALRVGLHHRRE